MSAYDTFKAGILGDPFDANKKPSRQGAVQGFLELQTQVDALQTATALGYPEFSNTTTGLAGTEPGEGFSVFSADFLTLYENVSNSTATQLGQIPLKPYIDDAVETINSKFGISVVEKLANLAKLKDGLFFAIKPSQCFQENTLAATTPCNLGDPVGLVKSVNNDYFMIAGKTTTRAFLAQDSFGNFYLDATAGATYVVENAAGVRWSPTRIWTHVAGFMGGGTLFTNDTAGNSRFSTVGTNFSGADFFLNGVTSNFWQELNPVAFSVPYIVSVVKEIANYRLWWNGIQSTYNAVPYDDSGYTLQAGYMMNRTLLPNIDNSNFSGRFYGSFWVAGVLSEAQFQMVQKGMNELCLPVNNQFSNDKTPAILDFENSFFQWGGSTRTISDLTDETGGVYSLDYVGWWDQEMTIVIDVESDPGAGSWSGDFVELVGENTLSQKISVHTALPEKRISYRSPGTPQDLPFTAPYVETGNANGNRERFAFILKPNDFVEIWNSKNEPGTDPIHRHHSSFPPDLARFTLAPQGWVLHRVAFYKGALQGEDLYDALSWSANDIHCLGDSFTVFLGRRFAAELKDLVNANGQNEVTVTTDGVGSVAFFEADGDGHHQRFAKTPQHWKKTLIMNDGGFEHGRGEVLIRSSIADIIAKLDHGANKRYLFLEPNPINPAGDSRNDDWIEAIGWVKEMIGSHYVSTLEAMFCEYSDAGDIADVANGIWPDTLRVDATHYTEAGQLIYARATLGAMIDFGYISGSTSLPGVAQNLTGGVGTLTWDKPASDGGHPILGYLVEGDVGAGFVTVATQGTAAPYTKQYIRSMTGLAAGNYRVSAITRKGTGSATTAVSVT